MSTTWSCAVCGKNGLGDFPFEEHETCEQAGGMNDIPSAIRVIGKTLREDPHYRYSWQANIAMAFQDEFRWAQERGETFNLHAVANKAADRFLQQLEKPTSDDQKSCQPDQTQPG